MKSANRWCLVKCKVKKEPHLRFQREIEKGFLYIKKGQDSGIGNHKNLSSNQFTKHISMVVHIIIIILNLSSRKGKGKGV